MFRSIRNYSKTLKSAFVFDIDGVLLRGSKAIPRAREALELLNHKQIPFVFMTNGGGVTEESRVQFLSETLKIPFSPLQIVQSHTPMKTMAPEYGSVLVVGGDGDNARKCAEQYGFRHVITPRDLVARWPAISPHHRFSADDLARARPVDDSTRVDAVLIFNDPRDMGTDLQVVLDVLNSEGGRIGTRRNFKSSRPAVPIVFSNNDFIWANDYPLPRFGQGAFRISVEGLYREINGLQLESTILGKPFKVQYDFAHHVLIDWVQKLKNNDTNSPQILPPLGQAPKTSPFDKIYMVGDNPESDIKGANDHGWESVLLRSGVYRDVDWEGIVAKPTVGVFDDVYEAVTQVVH